MPQVKRKERESFEAMMKRFSRKVQESGVIDRARETRFQESPPSKKQRKVAAIRRKLVREKYNYLRRIGKMEEFALTSSGRPRKPSIRVRVPKKRLKNL